MKSHVDSLKLFLAENNIDIDGAAELIGDQPERLERVLRAEETLGLTAALAIEAVRHELPDIEPGD